MELQPAKRRFLGADRFARGNVKQGETFSVDSGLGGSHTVKYSGHFDGRLLFERERSRDWPAECYWYENEHDAAGHVFILTQAGAYSQEPNHVI